MIIRHNYVVLVLLTLFLAGCQQAETPALSENSASTEANELVTQRENDPTPTQSSNPSAQKVEPSEPEAASSEVGEAKPQETAKSNEQQAPTLRMLSWNVESEGADSNVIAEQLAEMGGYDVYGLTEVLPQDFKRFRESLGSNYKYAYTRSGYNDRMQLLYNEERFELVRQFEMNEINFEERYRSPLVIHLRDRETQSEFLVMVNHLARGKAEVRTWQAERLVEWARDQNLPLIGIGDYNFDFEFATETGNDGFRAMMRDNIWQWVRPDPLVDTNWYDPGGDGNDDYPGSMLDFAFVAGPATDWESQCEIIVRPGDFPDDATTSDHRPFELLLNSPSE